MTRALPLLVVAVFATAVGASDVSGRKMVWAHYVPWLTPDNASQNAGRFYGFPQFEVGDDPYRDEVLRALDQGIDGFFNDMVAHKGGWTSFWDLRPFLKAAEGTPFQFGICLDAKIPVEQQVKELVKMLSAYGSHPNYPKWKEKFVVSTYTYFAWSPEEWRAIRAGCADAGYPLYVIANIEHGYETYSDAKIEAYAGLFERGYYFSNNGIAWMNWRSLEDEKNAAAACCAKSGAAFMPLLWPGYYGGWLNGRCSYYQPFLGFDTLQRRFDYAMSRPFDWLHVTTWNDHDETTLQSRRLTTGNPATIRAMSREFKGLPPAAETDVQFAYLRETMAGTLLRIETMRLKSADRTPVEVDGRLLDAKGNEVFVLPSRKLQGDWGRAEWLVPTTALAVSPLVTPEMTVKVGKKMRVVTLPPAFLVTTYLRNPETVKVSVADRKAIRSGFGLQWKDGVLSGYCAYEGDAELKRATLYRNEIPVTAFVRDERTYLPVYFTGHHQIELSVEGGQIARAVKSFETNGAPHFAWDARRVVSRNVPGWMRHTARIATTDRTKLTFANLKDKLTFTPRELVEAKRIVAGEGMVEVSCDGTIYDIPPVGGKSGKLNLSVWCVKPDPTDAFWVEYEFSDNTFAESRVKYPFAVDDSPVTVPIVETARTLEHTSGAAGLPDSRPFLTPRENLPVREMRVVDAKVSPFAVRSEEFDFEGDPLSRPKFPQRRWPMGAFRLDCVLTPLASDGAEHVVLAKNGWNEGPELKLLADGRLAALLTGGSNRGPKEFAYEVRSRGPLVRGEKVRVTLVSDCRAFRLLVDDKEQGRVDLPPLRCYGNLSPSLGAGVNGKEPSVALLHKLGFTGDCSIKSLR